MAETPRPWTVLTHGTLEKLSDRVWTVAGALPTMPLERRMTLIKRPDGRLVVHSAIALDEASMREIEAWGEPSELVVPNGWHRLDAHAYTQRYPKLRVYCPREAKRRVGELVRVHGSLEDLARDTALEVVTIDGVSNGEVVLAARDERGCALVFNDLLFNHKHVGGAQGAVMRLLGSTGGPRVTRVARLTMVFDGSLVAKALVELANRRGLYAAIPGHGDVIATETAQTLATVATTM
ncbi:MAG: hypothetical protein JNK05_34265 [Myxococcales bacterium]|nr:hypothetical protein [Myxococcales bacterium]